MAHDSEVEGEQVPHHTRRDRSGAPGGFGERDSHDPHDSHDGPIAHGNADLFNWSLIRDWVVFVWGAPRHHPRLAGAIFGTCLVLAIMAAAWLPRTYRTEARIMATRNLVMAALGNPGRAIPMDADSPTRGAAETILRRESLVALVNQTRLVERWQAARPAVLRIKDKVQSWFTGPIDEEARIDALVYLLEQRLKVTAVDGIITIQIDWQDAQTAYLLVTSAQQDFLETRHALEVSTIAEAISILEGHATEVQARIEADSQALRAARDARNAAAAPVSVAAAPSAAHRGSPVRESAELANLRLMLSGKRRAVADLESYRQRRLGELQAQLSELKATYTAAHPLIQATRESMESLSRDSPQLAQLRREEQELVAQVATLAGAGAGEDRQGAVAAAVAPIQPPVLLRELRARPARPGDDDSAETMRLRVNYAVQKYEAIVDRVEAARIELDTARAAFKYRYGVVRPAEVSKRPAKPNIPLTLVSGLILGVLLAFGGTAWLDRRQAALARSSRVEGPPSPVVDDRPEER